MMFKTLLDWLRPHEHEVYDLLNETGADLQAGAQEIVDAIQAGDAPAFERLRQGMNARKERASLRGVRLVEALSHRFMPAIEGEAVETVLHATRRVQDHLDQTTELLSLHGLSGEAGTLRELSESMVMGMRELAALLHGLPDDKFLLEAGQCMERLQRIETTADTLFREALERLFNQPTSPIELIKARDLLQEMEDTVDQVQRAGKIIYGTMQL